jgi:hypothetical protein
LIKVYDHHCGNSLTRGIWTPGGWEPPSIIEAKTEQAWQAESSGIATGTEGYVKYKIGKVPLVVPGGPPPKPELADTIYIYWNNPFVGVTSAKGSSSVSDVHPDCDAPDESQGTTFADPNSQFEVHSTRHTEDGTAVPSPLDGNEGPILFEVPIAPIVVFGELHIIEHAWVRFDIRTKGSVRQALPLAYDSSTGLRRMFQTSARTKSLRLIFQ